MDIASGLQLKRIFLETKLPHALEPLQRLAHNIWWSWNPRAQDLFEELRPEGLEAHGYNPIHLLDSLNAQDIRRLVEDQVFLAKLQEVDRDFQAYLQARPSEDLPLVGYFSMEYGLHFSLRLYSGGLGILAGDYLKQASDSNVRMVGVGLLYRYGYFQQSISLYGDQINEYPAQEFSKLPIRPVRRENGERYQIQVTIEDRPVMAKIWELPVGRIPLYLLDTELEENAPQDRSLTHQLYGGDSEHRLKQEILLGIGGVRLLETLGITPDVFHCNEGHAAFLGLERLRIIRHRTGLSLEATREVVRASSLFTTHTPVPAGHDKFHDGLLDRYLGRYVQELGISRDDFLAMGKIHPADPNEQFSMSHLAIRLSQEVNGVSRLHGAVSRAMFQGLYPGFAAEELHISHVTNSVHYPSWIARSWRKLFQEQFGPQFEHDQSNPDYWRRIQRLSSDGIFELRQNLKAKLLTYIRRQLQADLTRRGEKPAVIFEMLNGIDDRALVVGFARRFATYKRAHLLFSNLERLADLVNQPGRPVLFVFAGKAHPADQGGQALIRDIVQISKMPEFIGKVIFLEGYHMEMAKHLVQGVDVWLNTPTRPLEASGTSGMKATLNGVINFSVLDGWWDEGYRADAGWALSKEATYEDHQLQDELDAETIYNILENEIVPTYFDRDEAGVPKKWIGYVRNTIAEIAPRFTMKRMLDDYFHQFYLPLNERSRTLRQDHYAPANALVQWKKAMLDYWPAVQVLEQQVWNEQKPTHPSGQPMEASIRLFIGEIDPAHLGMEVVFFGLDKAGRLVPRLVKEMDRRQPAKDEVAFSCQIEPEFSGVYEYGFRLYARHDLLPHRQDFHLVAWLG